MLKIPCFEKNTATFVKKQYNSIGVYKYAEICKKEVYISACFQ